eukprot:TRINITY_DN6097_c0_g1_i3.p1 TRINITY_DN6097_c0_g1~~TRINITY_DN6097_c0_g1_i3.p1  ORF type:complete len:347 (-),score=37.85 TRINITY_DN6097_c0_g1_i3:209-1249(-)
MGGNMGCGVVFSRCRHRVGLGAPNAGRDHGEPRASRDVASAIVSAPPSGAAAAAARPASGDCKRCLSERVVYDIHTAEPTHEDCPVCLCSIDEDCVRTRCGHHYHRKCLDKYLRTSQHEFSGVRANRSRCPVCRRPLRASCGVEAAAASGRPLDIVAVPAAGMFCHIDRGYVFCNLGDFSRPGMLYLLTCNEDRKTPANAVMWTLDVTVRVNVYLNFRSEGHVASTGASAWLGRGGWRRNTNMRSTVSTGVPNGPYSGPVFSREFEPGRIELNGSNTWEGVYFVFVELLEPVAVPEPVSPSEATEASPVDDESLDGESPIVSGPSTSDLSGEVRPANLRPPSAAPA